MPMRWTETEGRLEAETRSEGLLRLLPAAFLAFWLCGWALGEFAVLGILIGGAAGLMKGGLPPGAMAAFLFLFLGLWLSLWTLGGWAAGGELLRLLFGRDALVVRPGSLRVTRSWGLFRSVDEVRFEEVAGIDRHGRGHALQLRLFDGRVLPLLPHAGREELAGLEAALRRRLPTPRSDRLPVPEGFITTLDGAGRSQLVTQPALREQHARFWMGFGAVLGGPLTVYALRESQGRAFNLLCAAAVAVMTALLVVAQRGSEDSLTVEGRQLTRRRVWGPWRREERREVDSLRFESTTDSDGDECFELRADGPQGPWSLASSSASGPVLQRGEWLSRTLGVPLVRA